MNDDLFSYLVATDQVDEFLGYIKKCPICDQALKKIDNNYYCEMCDKFYDNDLQEIEDNQIEL